MKNGQGHSPLTDSHSGSPSYTTSSVCYCYCYCSRIFFLTSSFVNDTTPCKNSSIEIWKSVMLLSRSTLTRDKREIKSSTKRRSRVSNDPTGKSWNRQVNRSPQFVFPTSKESLEFFHCDQTLMLQVHCQSGQKTSLLHRS
jgi:hypothetical protein